MSAKKPCEYLHCIHNIDSRCKFKAISCVLERDTLASMVASYMRSQWREIQYSAPCLPVVEQGREVARRLLTLYGVKNEITISVVKDALAMLKLNDFKVALVRELDYHFSIKSTT